MVKPVWIGGEIVLRFLLPVTLGELMSVGVTTQPGGVGGSDVDVDDISAMLAEAEDALGEETKKSNNWRIIIGGSLLLLVLVTIAVTLALKDA